MTSSNFLISEISLLYSIFNFSTSDGIDEIKTTLLFLKLLFFIDFLISLNESKHLLIGLTFIFEMFFMESLISLPEFLL